MATTAASAREGRAVAQRKVRLFPGLALAHAQLGAAQHARKDLDAAAVSYRAAVAADPQHVQSHSNLGPLPRAAEQGILRTGRTGREGAAAESFPAELGRTATGSCLAG